MNFVQISIVASEEEQEILISELSDLEATGFEQTDTHLLVYFDEDRFNSYEVNKALENYSFEINSIPQQNWNAVWESNFEPVVVDDFCGIRADFHSPIQNVEHQIIITPKMSFGTGHHATTHLMIQKMRDIDLQQKTVFDFGTGTGILAILAKKLGAASVTAIDVDDWSIANARENFEANGVKEIELYQSPIIPAKKFDVVLANINKNVILQNAEALKECLNQNALLLVSGLLKNDEEDIASAFKGLGLIKKQTTERNNWISILFSHQGKFSY